MKKLIVLIIVGISLLVLFIIYISIPTYVFRATIFGKPDIDDYKIFPYRIVESSDFRPWPVGSTYDGNVLLPNHRAFFEEYETLVFLVVKDGKLVFEEYWEGFDETSYCNSFEITNSIISILTGIAIGEGKIEGVDQKVEDFLPRYGSGSAMNLTIRDLLTMSSGINWNQNQTGKYSDYAKAYYSDNLDEILEKLSVAEMPGDTFEYTRINTQILAQVLQKATNMKLAHYASRKLWRPIQAKYNATWSLDNEHKDEKAFAGFNATPRDLARIGQLVLDEGQWKGEQIVPQDYMIQSIQPAGHLKDHSSRAVTYFGYSWWILHYKDYSIPYARGKYGQYIFIIPEKNAVVVRLGRQQSPKEIEHVPFDAYTYIDAALHLLGDFQEDY